MKKESSLPELNKRKRYQRDTQNILDGPTHFFFGDPHVVFHVRKDSGLDKEALVSLTTAPTHHLGPFLLSALDQGLNLVELFPIDLSTSIDE